MQNVVVNRARKNVALLALCQSLAMTCTTVLFTVAALIGENLTADKSLATLPLALLQLAVMTATIPASMLMQQWGRRWGFMLGTVIGLAGIVLGFSAVFIGSFPMFCGATVLMGVFNGFSGFYRFAAAEAATESFRAQAISLVVAGGVVAALLGPSIASWAKDWFQAEFAGALLAIVGIQALVMVLLLWIDMPPVTMREQQGKERSLPQIMQQPVFIVAVVGSMVGYGVMALIMTATPLAMVAVPHPFHAAASVIQWHVLGMFAPSFFTGFLIARFGVLNVILCGIGLSFLSIIVNLMGTDVSYFLLGLSLLGVGWNFMFVGSTTLLTQTYSPAEKAKTQAVHDFLMFGFVAAATFLSGGLLNSFNWAVVNYAAVPALVLALAALLWLRQQHSIQSKSIS